MRGGYFSSVESRETGWRETPCGFALLHIAEPPVLAVRSYYRSKPVGDRQTAETMAGRHHRSPPRVLDSSPASDAAGT